jgi:hypothetical protein
MTAWIAHSERVVNAALADLRRRESKLEEAKVGSIEVVYHKIKGRITRLDFGFLE